MIQMVPFIIPVSILAISMGENNFSAMCMPLIRATCFFCVDLSVFYDLIGCPFYFHSYLSGGMEAGCIVN